MARGRPWERRPSHPCSESMRWTPPTAGCPLRKYALVEADCTVRVGLQELRRHFTSLQLEVHRQMWLLEDEVAPRSGATRSRWPAFSALNSTMHIGHELFGVWHRNLVVFRRLKKLSCVALGTWRCAARACRQLGDLRCDNEFLQTCIRLPLEASAEPARHAAASGRTGRRWGKSRPDRRRRVPSIHRVCRWQHESR